MAAPAHQCAPVRRVFPLKPQPHQQPAGQRSRFSTAGWRRCGAAALCVALCFALRVEAMNGVITTIVGSGTQSFGGDDGPATSANLHSPRGMAMLASPTGDGGSVLYFADASNNRIRRVDADGIITTVAGNGLGTFDGDGALATTKGLQYPYSVAAVYNTSSDGTVLYIADSGNQRIRRVDEAGIITTAAGISTAGVNGDGGPATAAQLNTPFGVVAVFDASTARVVLYIADTGNHRIRRVDAAGVITTVAGVAPGGSGGDGGPATSAKFANPVSLAVVVNASSGGVVLYIADRDNHRIRRVDEGGIITTVTGSTSGSTGDGGAATAARLNNPYGVAAIANASTGRVVLFIADKNNNRIRRVDEAGGMSTVAGSGSPGFSGDSGPATAATLSSPQGVMAVANTSSGGVALYIADTTNNRIRFVHVSPLPSPSSTPSPSTSPSATSSPSVSASVSATSSPSASTSPSATSSPSACSSPSASAGEFLIRLVLLDGR